MNTKKILRDKYSLIKEENFRLKGFVEELIGVVQNNHGPHDESDIFVDCGDDECLGCVKASEYYTLNIAQTCKELQSLKDQLEKAEKVIEGIKTYTDGITFSGRRCGDSSDCSIFVHANNIGVVNMKTRQYFQEKQD